MKYLQWIGNNILFILTMFLLVFIPLYPKKPLLDIVNTWVYIRAEDFVVAVVLLIWSMLLFQKKVTLKTPLTIPILLFWIAGAIATFHGILIIFPGTANIFSNIAFLSYVRHIEYISLFFIAWSGMKDKRLVPYVAAFVVITLIGVILYGIGQKYAGFPAYLTMNEEVAKGEPVKISALGRVSSTFGGHYDLAAYLVLVIPLVVSFIFGVRNWRAKLLLLTVAVASFGLLNFTVSRISFFAAIIAVIVVILFQKKKLLLFSLPLLVIGGFIFARYAPALLSRFNSTVKEVDVLVDAKTGGVLGHPQEVSNTYFQHKTIKQEYLYEKELLATRSATASPSATIPYYLLPETVLLISSDIPSTGENLPSGSGYINLSLSPVIKKVGYYFYDTTTASSTSAQLVLIKSGDFLIKRALAYDLSFTTRFQGEWPNAFNAFKRNILFGSGYGSVSLAVDNNYLRILAETGIIGFLAFFGVFVVIGIYIKKILPAVQSPLSRSFIIGFAAGGIGLLLNALLIDVFDASKVAFYLWLLAGIALAILHFYQKTPVSLLKELNKILVSPLATIIGLSVLCMVMFLPSINNYFIGDDFTWLRWAATEPITSIGNSFISSDGFFYRPGTKLFFSAMYNIFWLNPTLYHVVAVLLHLVVAVITFFLSRKILRSSSWATLTSFLFLVMSGYIESIFWISAIGFLFASGAILTSLLLFIKWIENKNIIYFCLSLIASIMSLFFHEMGVITPLLCMLYAVSQFGVKQLVKEKIYPILLFLPIPLYLLVRYFSNSHWLSGDYNYNLLKLPFNFVGNAFGYLLLALTGPMSIRFYEIFRTFSREKIFISVILVALFVTLTIVLYNKVIKKMEKEDKRILVFGIGFFVIALAPFLGLGNIASRYSYLASIGVSILLVFGLRKFYSYLESSGQAIATMAMTIIVAIFAMFHIIQTQQVQGDWHTAGEEVQNFFVSIDSAYQDYWAAEPMTFYFVNTPIRHGEAWVFPVGLEDALWFTFRNPSVTVNQAPTVEDALNAIGTSENEKVFLFGDSGRVIEQKEVQTIKAP